MKLKELINSIEFLNSGQTDPEREITKICYDAREADENSIFVAISGPKSDRHIYIDDAIKNKAAAVVLEKDYKENMPYILVEDSRKALALLSARLMNNPEKKLKIIGVTGTNGKTTNTYLIKTVFEKAIGKKIGLIGTNQNMIGDKILPSNATTPEAPELFKLFNEMLLEGCEYCVMEVSSHSLDLSRVYGIEFEVAVFTNLTQDHLDYHKTLENYKLAKAKIFENCKNAVINLDDPSASFMLSKSKAQKNVTISTSNNEATFVAKNIKLSEGSVRFELLTLGEIMRVELKIPGMFSVYNALTSIACANVLGLDLKAITEALKEANGVEGRAELVPTPAEYTVLIDYAHTPDALENIIKTVKGYAKKRVIVVFGCGGDRDKTKRPKMGEIAVKNADLAIITSDNPRTEKPIEIINDILKGVTGYKNYIVVENRKEAIKKALETAQKDDIIILAGKGHEKYQEINGVKNHFDEREIIGEFFKS